MTSKQISRSKKDSSEEKEGKAEKKAAEAVANEAAGAYDFLEALAVAAPEKENNKVASTAVKLQPTLAAALDSWAEKVNRLKELEGEITELQEELFPHFRTLRLETARASAEFCSSVKIASTKVETTFTVKNAYTGFSVKQKGVVIDAIAASEKITKEEATKIFDAKFRWNVKVELKKEAFQDPEAMKILATHLSKYLDVTKKAYPKTEFHEGALLNKQDEKIMNAVIETGLLRPHAPSMRLSGTKSD